MSKRFLIIHGCGPLAMAASSTLSAASRYCSIRKEETCSASALLSKPFADVSGGSRSFRSTSTPSRSRTVFSYSARLSRRRTTRPWAAFRAASAAATRPLIQSVRACDVFLRRARLLLRGHGAGLDLLQHGQPPLAVGLVVEVRREAVQAEVALGLVPRVTGLAVLREKRPGRVGIGLGIGAACARRLDRQRANAARQRGRILRSTRISIAASLATRSIR